jgi:GTP1/Obg family GTP-binding protein
LIVNISTNYYIDAKYDALNENITRLGYRISGAEDMIKDVIAMSYSNRVDIAAIRKYEEESVKSKFNAIRNDLNSIKTQLRKVKNLDKFDRELESVRKSVDKIEDTMDNKK